MRMQPQQKFSAAFRKWDGGSVGLSAHRPPEAETELQRAPSSLPSKSRCSHCRSHDAETKEAESAATAAATAATTARAGRDWR